MLLSAENLQQRLEGMEAGPGGHGDGAWRVWRRGLEGMGAGPGGRCGGSLSSFLIRRLSDSRRDHRAIVGQRACSCHAHPGHPHLRSTPLPGAAGVHPEPSRPVDLLRAHQRSHAGILALIFQHLFQAGSSHQATLLMDVCACVCARVITHMHVHTHRCV